MEALFDISVFAAGYGYAIVLGHFAVKWLVNGLQTSIRVELSGDNATAAATLSGSLGMVERALYTAAWQLGYPLFIAAWLVLKSAGRWRGWKQRPSYHLYLFSNALSLAFGVVGGRFIGEYWDKPLLEAILAPAGLAAGVFILMLWIRSRPPAPWQGDDDII